MNSELKNRKWVAIINPLSGKLGMHNEWSAIQNAFKEEGVSCVYMFTEHEGHAIDLARDLAKDGYRDIVTVGGDGTLNEVLNGVMQSGVNPNEMTIAVIPNGTGNDWARYWNVPFDKNSAVALLKKGISTPVDIGRCTYMTDGKPGERYFLNIAGMGFEVKVLKQADHIRWMSIFKGRRWIYGLAVVYSAIFSKAHEMTFTANEQTVTKHVFSMSVGNGTYSGGGFKQTPMATPTDGAFDVMLMSRLTFKTAIMGLKYLFKGKLLKHPAVKNFRTEKIIVSKAIKSDIEVDGIVLHSGCPVTFTILPKAINFIVPQS